jgi:hypothetical protein
MMAIVTQFRLTPTSKQIAEQMIALAHCSKRQRIIATGWRSAELMSELHRGGYVRVATTANCGLPAEQYDAALVDWRQHSIKALETTLDWLVGFLASTGVLIIWVDPQDAAANRKLRAALESHGLVVEAGIVREYGSAVSARWGEGTGEASVASLTSGKTNSATLRNAFTSHAAERTLGSARSP